MKVLHFSQLHQYIGKKIRVVYAVNPALLAMTNTVDHLITREVTLTGVYPSAQAIEFERDTGERVFLSPAEVFLV